jgi:O-antigen/teichoic acid export membrane protein
MALPMVVTMLYNPTLAALGKSGVIVKVEILKLLLSITALLLAIPYGLTAAAIAYVARAYLTTPIQIWILRREAGISIRRTIRAIFPPLLASTFMAAGLYAAIPLLKLEFGTGTLYMLTSIAGGAVGYLLLLLIFGFGFVTSQLSGLRSMRRR